MAKKTCCPTCGRTLETSGADCPGCLLSLALEPSLDQSPGSGRHALDAGSRVGPNMIVSKLAEE